MATEAVREWDMGELDAALARGGRSVDDTFVTEDGRHLTTKDDVLTYLVDIGALPESCRPMV